MAIPDPARAQRLMRLASFGWDAAAHWRAMGCTVMALFAEDAARRCEDEALRCAGNLVWLPARKGARS